MSFRPTRRIDLPQELVNIGRHLVFSEGTMTEINYVESIKASISSRYRTKPNDIDIICCSNKKSLHTIELVDFAVQTVKKQLKDGMTIDGVWIFFDKDSFSDFDLAISKIANLNKKQFYDGYNDPVHVDWNACFSNECFELWVYLYFNDLVTPIPRSDYITKINDFIKAKGFADEYSKSLVGLHSFLSERGGKIETAIKYAEKKDVKAGIPKSNPSTGVYLFAKRFVRYLDKK